MGQLTGEVAIVTGAAVGIGRAIAVAFGREGAKVVVNFSKSRKEAEETANLVKQAGGEPLVIQADVAQDRQVRAMVAETLDRLGRVDILVNNAGITAFVDFPDLERLTDEVWDRLYNINVKGTFFCCRAVVPAMRKQGHGRIINMASIAGRFGFQNRSPYAATKWGVIGFTKTLALELGEFGIRANAIAPGAVAGDRIERVFAGRAQISGKSMAEVRAAAMAEQSIKAMIDPKDIAALAVFLASDAAKSISGQVLPIDNDRQRA